MPIRVTCECDQTFAVADDRAGTTMKCPKCGQPVKIPAPQPKRRAPKGQAPTGQPAGPAAGGLGSLLEEVGITAAAQAGPKCPSCGAPVPPNAIICIECGYNSQTGQRMETVGAVAPGSAGKMSEAEKLVAKAAAEIAKAPLKDPGHGEGLMAYVFTLGLLLATMIALALGGVFMYFVNTVVFPEGEKQTFAGTASFTLCTFGTVVVFLAYVDVVGQAFHDRVYHGVITLLCQVYAVIYALMKSIKLLRAILMGLVGANMILCGGLVYFEAQQQEEMGTSWRAIFFLLALLFADVWFVTWSRIAGMAFGEENGLLHGALTLVVPLYPYIYGFMRGKKYLVWVIVALVSGLTFLVFFILVLVNLPAATEVEEEALLAVRHFLA